MKSRNSKFIQLLGLLGGLLGAVVGWQLMKLFRYTSDLNWMPGLGTAVLMLVFVKSPLHPKFFRAAIATAVGHVFWFVAAALFLKTMEPILDIIFLSLGVVLLWLRPNLAVVLFFGLLQIAGLVYHGLQITTIPVGSSAHVALTVHCIWRFMFILFLVSGYIRMRTSMLTASERDSSEVDQQTPATIVKSLEVALGRTIKMEKTRSNEGNTPEDW